MIEEPKIEVGIPEENPLIDSSIWNECSMVVLYQQMDELNTRYFAAIDTKNISIANQILKGIDQLKVIINSRDIEKSKYVTFLV